MLVSEFGNVTITCLAFTDDGGQLLVGTKQGFAYSMTPLGDWNQITETAFGPYDRHEINAILADAKSESLFLGMDPGWMRTPLGARQMKLENADLPIAALALLDDRTLAVGVGSRVKDTAGSFELWDVSGLPKRREPRFKEPKGVRAIAVHRPSRTVAWSSGSRKITVWDPRKQDPVGIPLKHLGPGLAFHPDGSRIAVAQEWGAVIVDVAKKHEVQTLTGHTGRVTSVAYRPDGVVLTTGSWDGTVRLWEVATGKLITALSGPPGRIAAIAYDNDGLRLAAAGDAGNVVIYDAE